MAAFFYTIYAMDSIQVSIQAEEAQQDILISFLSDLGAEGFEQEGQYLIAYFNEATFPGYEVNEVLKGYTFHTQTIREQNWNSVWESNFQPVVVGDFCAVRAAFHEPIRKVVHEIIITPKMSFGTGHHATTYMMIEQMGAMDLAGQSVFDFGTGTGILAILAEKLGAARITAIDIDPWSIENAHENIEMNQGKAIALELTSKLPQGPFDIILANINRNVILQYLPELDQILADKGRLLLSGLLLDDEKDIVEACEKTGLRLRKRADRNNWVSLLLIK